MTRKKRLGRGLENLLNTSREIEAVPRAPDADATLAPTPAFAAPEVQVAESTDPGQSEGDIVHLSVYEIEDNPFQPRRVFGESEIASLAESLKEHDILQPILVRVVDGRYQLISGERRLRAAIKANWQTIPARLRTADDRLVSELAIVENLQRKDLNPIEKALSFRRYIDEHHCTQEDLASRLKIDRSTIANLMRLLELPGPIQEALQTGVISAGHARALLPLGDEQVQVEFCDQIRKNGLSVRAVERAVSEHISAEDSPGPDSAARKRRSQDRQIEALQDRLKSALGTKVQIKAGKRERGQIVIHYTSHAEFERIQSILSNPESNAGIRAA